MPLSCDSCRPAPKAAPAAAPPMVLHNTRSITAAASAVTATPATQPKQIDRQGTENKEASDSLKGGRKRKLAGPDAGGEAPRRKEPVPTTTIDEAKLAKALSGELEFKKRGSKRCCPFCGGGFVSPSKVRRHLKVHVRENELEKEKLKTWRDVLKREREKEVKTKTTPPSQKPKKKKAFGSQACPTCNRIFTSAKNFRIHCLCHEGKSPYECKLCDKHFSRADHLKGHLLSISHQRKAEEAKGAAKTDKSVDEGSSSKKKKTSQDVAEGLPKGKGQERRRRKCEQCNCLFGNEYSYKMHVLVHEKRSPFACHECGVWFSRRQHLQRHNETPSHQERMADLEGQGTSGGNDEEEDDDDDRELPLEDLAALTTDGVTGAAYVYGDGEENADAAFVSYESAESQPSHSEMEIHSAAYSALSNSSRNDFKLVVSFRDNEGELALSDVADSSVSEYALEEGTSSLQS